MEAFTLHARFGIKQSIQAANAIVGRHEEKEPDWPCGVVFFHSCMHGRMNEDTHTTTAGAKTGALRFELSDGPQFLLLLVQQQQQQQIIQRVFSFLSIYLEQVQ
jgi:hypothetical protein